ncbi:hypothetical protein Tco_0524303 [Tanacetum coccineum]
MNPYFAMNPNDIEEERQPNCFDVDDESDVYFLQQAYQYHEMLVEDENRPVLTRNPIHRDREGAEDHLMDDYFDDPWWWWEFCCGMVSYLKIPMMKIVKKLGQWKSSVAFTNLYSSTQIHSIRLNCVVETVSFNAPVALIVVSSVRLVVGCSWDACPGGGASSGRTVGLNTVSKMKSGHFEMKSLDAPLLLQTWFADEECIRNSRSFVLEVVMDFRGKCVNTVNLKQNITLLGSLDSSICYR